jgi:tetratricopeptide (TPR) repeat protein
MRYIAIVVLFFATLLLAEQSQYQKLIAKSKEQIKNSQYIEAKDTLKKAIEDEPKSVIAYFELSNLYITVGDYANAIESLQKTLSIDPYYKSFITNYLLGYALNNQREYKKAMHYLNLAKKIEPKNSTLYSAIGYSYIAQGEYKNALNSYHKMLSLEPDSAEANYLIGLSHYLLKEYQKASKYLKKAIKLHPEYAEAYIYLAITKGYLQEYSGVITDTKEAIRLSKDIANQVIEAEVTPLVPTTIQKMGIKAGIYYAMDNLIEAKELYKKMYKPYPTDKFLNSILAQIEIADENYIKGIEYLKDSIKYGADNPYTYYLLSKALLSTNKPKEAQKYIDMAIKKSPKEAKYHLLNAKIKEKLSSSDEAIKSYAKASSLDSTLDEANLKVGIKLAQESRYQEALDKFVKNLSHNKDDSLANYYVGFTLVMLDEYAKAIEYLNKAIEYQPEAKVFNYHYYLGYSYYESKEYDKAIKELNIAKEISKEDSYVYYYLGLSYAKTKEYRDMQKALISTIGLDPSNIHAKYILGSYYYKENMHNKALKYLKDIADNHTKEYPKAKEMVADIYKSLDDEANYQKYTQKVEPKEGKKMSKRIIIINKNKNN